MIYLRKVIVLAESEKCVEELEILGQKLRKEGMDFQCFVGECAVDCRVMTDAESVMDDEERDKQRRLWIVDSASKAVSLRMRGEAVLALLHEENRNQDFSGILYACENPGELDAEYIDRIYRRYAGLPWNIAETERCMIRETVEEDVEAFFEIYKNPKITQYTEGLHPTIEQEKQYVRDYIEKVYGFYGFGVWTILRKDTGEIIGRAGFSYREGYEEPEIGFVIGAPWQRQGYAREVCSALLGMSEELGLESVQAFVAPENEASAGLCEKLGLHKIGTVKIAGRKYNRFYKKMVKMEC